jgi:predicted transporter
MFALPLFGSRALQPAPPWWLRIAAASGFLMTLIYVTLSIFPIIDVKSGFAFTCKISAVIISAIIVGAGILVVAKRKRSRTDN